MKPNEFKPFQELSHTDKLLRLDWFWGVKCNLHENDNPLVECIFTPFEWAKDFTGKTTPKPKRNDQFMASIAVGYLPVLQIGQHIKNGKWAPREDWLEPETITFDLDVSDTASIVECTLPDIDFPRSSNFIAPDFESTANQSGIKKLKGILRRSSKQTIRRVDVRL